MYSLTQAGNLAVFVGLIVMIANHYGFKVSTDEVTQVLGAIIQVVGIVTSWIGRYRQGDVTIAGFKK